MIALTLRWKDFVKVTHRKDVVTFSVDNPGSVQLSRCWGHLSCLERFSIDLGFQCTVGLKNDYVLVLLFARYLP